MKEDKVFKGKYYLSYVMFGFFVFFAILLYNADTRYPAEPGFTSMGANANFVVNSEVSIDSRNFISYEYDVYNESNEVKIILDFNEYNSRFDKSQILVYNYGYFYDEGRLEKRNLGFSKEDLEQGVWYRVNVTEEPILAFNTSSFLKYVPSSFGDWKRSQLVFLYVCSKSEEYLTKDWYCGIIDENGKMSSENVWIHKNLYNLKSQLPKEENKLCINSFAFDCHEKNLRDGSKEIRPNVCDNPFNLKKCDDFEYPLMPGTLGNTYFKSNLYGNFVQITLNGLDNFRFQKDSSTHEGSIILEGDGDLNQLNAITKDSTQEVIEKKLDFDKNLRAIVIDEDITKFYELEANEKIESLLIDLGSYNGTFLNIHFIDNPDLETLKNKEFSLSEISLASESLILENRLNFDYNELFNSIFSSSYIDEELIKSTDVYLSKNNFNINSELVDLIQLKKGYIFENIDKSSMPFYLESLDTEISFESEDFRKKYGFEVAGKTYYPYFKFAFNNVENKDKKFPFDLKFYMVNSDFENTVLNEKDDLLYEATLTPLESNLFDSGKGFEEIEFFSAFNLMLTQEDLDEGCNSPILTEDCKPKEEFAEVLENKFISKIFCDFLENSSFMKRLYGFELPKCEIELQSRRIGSDQYYIKIIDEKGSHKINSIDFDLWKKTKYDANQMGSGKILLYNDLPTYNLGIVDYSSKGTAIVKNDLSFGDLEIGNLRAEGYRDLDFKIYLPVKSEDYFFKFYIDRYSPNLVGDVVIQDKFDNKIKVQKGLVTLLRAKHLDKSPLKDYIVRNIYSRSRPDILNGETESKTQTNFFLLQDFEVGKEGRNPINFYELNSKIYTFLNSEILKFHSNVLTIKGKENSKLVQVSLENNLDSCSLDPPSNLKCGYFLKCGDFGSYYEKVSCESGICFENSCCIPKEAPNEENTCGSYEKGCGLGLGFYNNCNSGYRCSASECIEIKPIKKPVEPGLPKPIKPTSDSLKDMGEFGFDIAR